MELANKRRRLYSSHKDILHNYVHNFLLAFWDNATFPRTMDIQIYFMSWYIVQSKNMIEALQRKISLSWSVSGNFAWFWHLDRFICNLYESKLGSYTNYRLCENYNTIIWSIYNKVENTGSMSHIHRKSLMIVKHRYMCTGPRFNVSHGRPLLPVEETTSAILKYLVWPGRELTTSRIWGGCFTVLQFALTRLVPDSVDGSLSNENLVFVSISVGLLGYSNNVWRDKRHLGLLVSVVWMSYSTLP